MIKDNKIWLAQSMSDTDSKQCLLPSMANRHGLIAGATGTGKTVTMKVLAEGFSDMGVPVFLADIKGDLTGTAFSGTDSPDMQNRIEYFNLTSDFEYRGYPCRFWDIFGEIGCPARVTVSGIGPMLLARLLNLTEVQTGVLNIVFKVADDNGLLLLDLKDLRALLSYVGTNAKEYTLEYGNVSSQSVGAIQRALLAFEQEGGEVMFGEPQLEVKDWIRTDTTGRGFINILESSKLVQNPLTYSTFMLWMLTELYERLPEVGDLDKPRLVFFFDEAHMLFTDAPKALVAKIEQIIKLVRSKGVGIYFVTQSPSDIPDSVLAQLGNRVQHALRAYTPAEQKKVKAAAASFRKNPNFDTEEKLMELGTGEALVSFLDEKGVPAVVEAAKILPPQSKIGVADQDAIDQQIAADEFDLKYRESVDRESAYEIIARANQQLAEEKEQEQADKQASKTKAKKQSILDKAAYSATASVSSSISHNIVYGLTGGKKKSTAAIVKQAAKRALASAMRNTIKMISRGDFGNTK